MHRRGYDLLSGKGVHGLIKLENAPLSTGGKVGDYANFQGPAFRIKSGRDFWGRWQAGAAGGRGRLDGEDGVTVVREEKEEEEEEEGYAFESAEFQALQRRLEPLQVRAARLQAKRAARG